MTAWSFASHTPVGSAETFFNTNVINCCEIRAGATDYPSIYEVGISLAGVNASGSRLYMYQTTTEGTNPVASPNILVNDDGGNNSSLPGIVVAFYWTAQPLIATGTLIRATSVLNSGGNNEGPVVYWRFPRGLKLAPNTSFIIRGTGSTNFNGYDYWVEFS